jgi:non-specific serine/threonine protein kinase
VIGQTISQYKITAKLGEGGMGEVYLAEDLRLDRQVALKFLPRHFSTDQDARVRFLREAKALAALSHPNIVHVYDVSEYEGQPFIAMEYIDGQSLKALIGTGEVTVETALELIGQAAEGLAAAHKRDIVHRDIKSENIVVSSEGRVKVMDFGLATWRGVTKVTTEGSTLGTRAYMSPEQSMGGKVDHRADLWSLGVVLYELVAERLPFSGEHDAAIAYSIANETPEPLARYKSGSPAELQHIVSKCLTKKQDERYQSAAELLSDLRRLSRSANSFPAIAEPATTRKMLAVLPFENLGPTEDEYFADGITEEIISRLASVKDLGVISRTSAMQYKGTCKSMREIGAELGADHILEGTVRWAKGKGGASRVRITPQLIKVADDTHLWSDRYDHVIEDIFEVQSEIAEQVIDQLNVALLTPERAAINVHPTESLDAYNVYLRGREYMNRPSYTQRDFNLAVEMFERAVKLDPKFVLAWAGLAKAHSSLYHHGHDKSDSRRNQSKQAIERAISLQPDSPEAQLAYGLYLYRCTKDYDTARENFEQALASAPNSSEVWQVLGAIRRRRGDCIGGLECSKQAFELDPRNTLLPSEIGITLTFMRRYDQADQYIKRAIDMAPDQLIAYWARADNHIAWKGDLAAARDAIENISQEARRSCVSLFVRQFMFERKFSACLEYLESMKFDLLKSQGGTTTGSLLMAQLFSMLGESDKARGAFRIALDQITKALDGTPDDHRLHLALSQICAGLNEKEGAITSGLKAVALCPIDRDAILGAITLYDMAVVYATIGEPERACDELEQVLHRTSVFSRHNVRLDPAFDPLRDHPRYKSLMAQEETVL